MKTFADLFLKATPLAKGKAADGTVRLSWDSKAGAAGNIVVQDASGTRRTLGTNAGTGTPVTGAKATGTLTSTGTAPANGATVTIDGKVYTFQTTLTNVDGNVLIGASAAVALDNLQAAVNGAAGAGTTYAAATVTHPTVDATTNTNTTQVFAAKNIGAYGNTIATAETSANLSFGAATLTGGSNTTAGSKGDMLIDGTNIYIAVADNTTASAAGGWRKIAHSAL